MLVDYSYQSFILKNHITGKINERIIFILHFFFYGFLLFVPVKKVIYDSFGYPENKRRNKLISGNLVFFDSIKE